WSSPICGRAWTAVVERDPSMLAAEVLDLFTTDEYGARGEVIIAFATALGTAGLDELERIARERLDHGPAGKHQYLAVALENIADARGDVDGYIAAKRLAGSEAAAVREIVERLVAVGRLDEVLHWAERSMCATLRGRVCRPVEGRHPRSARPQRGRAGSPLVDIRDLVGVGRSGQISRP